MQRFSEDQTKNNDTEERLQAPVIIENSSSRIMHWVRFDVDQLVSDYGVGIAVASLFLFYMQNLFMLL
jgi:hypothetical protein